MFQSSHPRSKNAKGIQTNLLDAKVRRSARTIRLVGRLFHGSNLLERFYVYCHAIHTAYALRVSPSLAQKLTSGSIHLLGRLQQRFRSQLRRHMQASRLIRRTACLQAMRRRDVVRVHPAVDPPPQLSRKDLGRQRNIRVHPRRLLT